MKPRSLLRGYGAIARVQIRSNGGIVEKFIGDAVVGLFGTPLAHEDDPARAIASARGIIDEMRNADLGLQVRIGVNTGEAFVHPSIDPSSGEGLATGDCINTAARLQSLAPAMGIMVGDRTRDAARSYRLLGAPSSPEFVEAAEQTYGVSLVPGDRLGFRARPARDAGGAT